MYNTHALARLQRLQILPEQRTMDYSLTDQNVFTDESNVPRKNTPRITHKIDLFCRSQNL